MIETICNRLTDRIRLKMPEVDDERAEIINYGLQLVIGEIPKTFVILGLAYLLGVFELSIFALLVVAPYRTFSGGFHLKSHIGCILGTTLFYCVPALIGKYVEFSFVYTKYILVACIWIFSMVMIKLYAPADTENVPILRKKDRKIKQIMSYITMTITLIICLFIKDSVFFEIILFSILFQSISITRLAYRITRNKYGYEEYCKTQV